MFFRKKEPQIIYKSGIRFPVPTTGYGVMEGILSSYAVIEFAVPAHEWSKLAESSQWQKFQKLLEEVQKEYIRELRSVGKCPQEYVDYI